MAIANIIATTAAVMYISIGGCAVAGNGAAVGAVGASSHAPCEFLVKRVHHKFISH